MPKPNRDQQTAFMGLSALAVIGAVMTAVCVCAASLVALGVVVRNYGPVVVGLNLNSSVDQTPTPTLVLVTFTVPTATVTLTPTPELLIPLENAVAPVVEPSPTASPTLPPPPTPEPTSTPLPEPTATPTNPPPATATNPPPPPTPTPVQIEHVVIISVDGLRPDAVGLAETPTLNSLRFNGVFGLNAKTIIPAATLIAHASMLGGMIPDKHGIYWNEYAPDLGKIKGPTLFSAAHDAGKSTAMVVGKEKLDHLNLPGSVDIYHWVDGTDIDVKNRAVEVIQAGLPSILFIHFPDVDWEGHATGWMSPGQLAVISRTDGYVGDVMAALTAGGYLSNTLIIIASDHGGSGTSHYSESWEDTTITWLAVGPGVPAGLQLERQINIYDTAPTALFALNLPAPPEWDGQVVTEIFPDRAIQ